MNYPEVIGQLLRQAGVTGELKFTAPPHTAQGDLALACFDLAKESGGRSPAAAAKDLAASITQMASPLVEQAQAAGPYVNFFLRGGELARLVLPAVGDDYGAHTLGKEETIMVEFAHPNTHKAFHVGHLRNIVTGESLARLFQNAGYTVVRANYQGDIGLHIGKCLWGLLHGEPPADQLVSNQQLTTPAARVKVLGEAYARGAAAYEADESAKKEIQELNGAVYTNDPSIRKIYTTTRAWSLEYFDTLYRRLDTRFDRLYFESEMFSRGKEIVEEWLPRGVFVESEGAVIFPGKRFGLHDRVFLTRERLPTYEAKDLALAERQFADYHPAHIYHVVATEQSEYFRVLFQALEATLPASRGREHHLVYGWVRLREGKMSSRTGQVVLAEWLLDTVGAKIREMMGERAAALPDATVERIAVAAVKYAFLKTGVSNELAFDLERSVSLSGDSGPYLLYMVARMKSILRQQSADSASQQIQQLVGGVTITTSEKRLLLQIAEFPAVTRTAAERTDPSLVAHYLLTLAQRFSDFYETCPVLKAEPATRTFRLALLHATQLVLERGLQLLGIATVEEM
ncbi:MAG: arginine--tRNA ligase [Candidatus Magasanikbacteria bacterium]|nr:arginine--tRNA ligase [Candidatus Magasanikbacteria bacterium]